MSRLINGNAFCDWLKEYGQEYIHGKKKISLMYIWKHIQDMPTIEPERKVGKWKKLSNDTFHCRECGKTFIVIQGQDYMNFCPNCGVYMRGERK